MNKLALTIPLFWMVGCATPFFATEDRLITLDHQLASPISVETGNGSVDFAVDPSLADVVVKAVFSTPGMSPGDAERRLAESRVVTSRRADGALVISAEFPEPRWPGDGCSMTIRVPSTYDLDVATSNGRIDVTGTTGFANLHSTNGNVALHDHNGDARVETSNGRVELIRVTGEADVSTSNGQMTLVDIDGPVQARSSNSRIEFVASPHRIAPFMLHSSNGRIRVSLPGHPRVSLDLRTSNGGIVIEDPYNMTSAGGADRTIAVGGGGELGSVSTSNGSIDVWLGDN